MVAKVRVAVIGCGVVGALTAYELSRDDRFQVAVWDRTLPGQGSTGAALGILMGVISHKKKGRRWHRCWAGLERYETLVPELEAQTGISIPYNQQGLLRLCFEGEDMAGWQRLAEARAKQGLPLEVLDLEQLAERYPQVQATGQGPTLIGAVSSPRDRQIHPKILTQALVQAAQANGVQFHFNAAISDVHCEPCLTANAAHTSHDSAIQKPAIHCQAIAWDQGSLATDQIIITAGLQSTAITQQLAQSSPSTQVLDLRPVLGQALQISLPHPLTPGPQPVINGQDIHIAPLPSSATTTSADYWIGATVELPDAAGHPPALEQRQLDQLLNTATQFCPALKEGTILRQWSGLRPRPEGRPAPVLEPLAGYDNVLLATGHYRNGVLLAPASAQWVKAKLEARLSTR